MKPVLNLTFFEISVFDWFVTLFKVFSLPTIL